MAVTRPMPAAFLGHGSPMNTLERNRYTEAWRGLGTAVPRPRQASVKRLRSRVFIGLPCPRNAAGMGRVTAMGTS